MNKISLNGNYKLYITDGKNFNFDGVDRLGEPVDAVVPGNAELDLMRANLLPDLYFADNIRKAEYLESKDFVYVKDFEFNSDNDCHRELVFKGVDTIAEYYLNGVKIGESENAFVEYKFSVDNVLKNGKNRLVVHIFSSVNHATKYEYTPLNIGIYDGCCESLNIRKRILFRLGYFAQSGFRGDFQGCLYTRIFACRDYRRLHRDKQIG